MHDLHALFAFTAIVAIAACNRDPSRAPTPAPIVSVGDSSTAESLTPLAPAEEAPVHPIRDVAPAAAQIKCADAGVCEGPTPVCCTNLGGGADRTYRCTPSWEACTNRKGNIYLECRSRRDCAGGESCCHVVARGERCEASACGQGDDTVCQSIDDCPEWNGQAPKDCKLQVGAWVVDEYGFCEYD